jgi:hypothetical protein
MSWIVHYTAQKIPLGVDTVRQQFNDLVLITSKPVDHHTHGTSAANRSDGSLFIDRLGAMTGLTPFYSQMSKADVRNSRSGSRTYYWAKDLGVQPLAAACTSKHLLAMVDVDYYVDMPNLLNTAPLAPIIMYTLQPKSVARKTENYCYTFNQKDELVYQVTGGATYIHKVWDYNTDNLITTWWWYGIPIRTTAYLIDHRSMDQDHDMVLLTPLARWGLIGGIFARMLQGSALGQYHVVVGEFTRLITHTKTDLSVHTGKTLGYAVSTTSLEIDDAIASIARTSKYDLTLPQVLGYNDGDRIGGTVLLEYHKSKIRYKPTVVFPVEQGVRSYQYYELGYDPDAKPSMVAFMNPVLHGCFAPKLSLANERVCVNKRIKEIASPHIEMTTLLNRLMNEFLELMIPEQFVLDPVDMDEIFERQSRPTQRAIIYHALYEKPRRLVKMFLKREAYQNIKDPRPISTINGPDKINYSLYLYAFSNIVRKQSWYAFGRTPLSIAQRVGEICSKASSVSKTDFSRMDGRVADIVREFEQRAMMRAFRQMYHRDMLEAMRSQYCQKGVSTLGIKYDTEFARLSGSPETADFNSLLSAFTGYGALRTHRVKGRFLSPREAYDGLGLYGGDDGFTGDVDVGAYKRMATSLGQVLEIEKVERGRFGVDFLARVYGPNIWFGDINSVCDLPRTLSKFHATPALPPNVTPKMKFMEKITALSFTDRHTPIIEEMVLKAQEIEPNYTYGNILSIWGSTTARNEQYPNDPSDWMYDYAVSVLPEMCYRDYFNYISGCKTIEEILCIPTFNPPVQAKADSTVIVDDEIIGGYDGLKKIPLRRKQRKRNRTKRKV